MSIMLRFLFLLVLVLGSACRPEETVVAGTAADKTDRAATGFVLRRPVTVFAQPDLDARPLATRPAGRAVQFSGRVSTHLESVFLEGRELHEPWVGIGPADGQPGGWIIADPALFFAPADSAASRRWRTENYLRCLWGDQYESAYRPYCNWWQSGGDGQADSWVAELQRGEELRVLLQERLLLQPGLQALIAGLGPEQAAKLLPGYLREVRDGQWLFWRDLREWHRIAGRTTDASDDSLAGLLIAAVGPDSIAFDYAAWEIAGRPGQVHSLLGRGIHLDLLRRADGLYRSDSLLRGDLRRLADQLLTDITHPDRSYWEGRSAVLSELDSILAADWQLLRRGDLIGLQVRRRQLSRADSLGIKLNVRSGIYD